MGETELERRLNLEIEYMNETRLFPPGRDIPAACGDGDEHAHRAGAFKFWRENRRLRAALEEIAGPPNLRRRMTTPVEVRIAIKALKGEAAVRGSDRQ